MGQMVMRRALMTPTANALTFEGASLTFEDLAQNILAAARLLTDLGVNKGDRVGYIGLNHPRLLEVLYASSLIGAVLVPINYRLTPQEIAFIAEDAGLHVLCADQAAATVLEQGLEGLGCAHFLGVDFENAVWQSMQNLLIARSQPLDASHAEASHAECVVVSEDDIALIMYTSGTTGRPKGAQLTHGNIFWNLLNAKFMEETMRHATLTCAPLFHIGGLNVTTHPSLVSGVHVVLHKVFDAEQILVDIERYGISTMFGAPTMFDMMRREPRFDETDFSSVLAFNCGAAPVPLPLIETYASKNVTFCQGYGLTETSPYVSVLSTADAQRKKGSAGKPLMFTEVKIVDARDQACLARERGEILVRGPNVTPGYWQLPDATAEAFDSQGWFSTGDIGYLDDDGYLFIADRKKDMIITGGENVYPAEVESELLAHPAIAEVAIIGLPDDKWGERVTAVITLSDEAEPSLESLDQFLADRLARYKRPRALYVVDELPRNPAGKVQKFALRDELSAVSSPL